MAAQQKQGTFPKSVPRRPSRYWTAERLEEALDYVIGQDGAIGVDRVAHVFRAGHDLEDDDDGGTCDRCGDEYAQDGLELLSALAVLRDEAEPDTKWAGLSMQVGSFSYGQPLRFAPARAAEWVAEQREATKRQRHRAQERRQVPDPRLGLSDAFWPEERIEVARGYADRLLKVGDLERASKLRYETIPDIEKWQMMRIVASTPTRRVLTDYEGSVWVAVPIEDTSLTADDVFS